MNNRAAPGLVKWPFVIGDLALVGLAFLLVTRSSGPIGFGHGVLCGVLTLAGACLGAWPFVKEYQGALNLAEAEMLATPLSVIRNLEEIQARVVEATSQWQRFHEKATGVVTSASELSNQMQAKQKEFCAFLQSTQDAEKQHLHLQVEKLRKGEREWLQTVVHILDHVFALHAAARRSGQPRLIAQLEQFQGACQEAVRRLGLVAFSAAPAEAFDPSKHQLESGDPGDDGRAGTISELLALGYTFQGELVRRALVRVQAAEEPQVAKQGAH